MLAQFQGKLEKDEKNKGHELARISHELSK
jgi:hypothetical protein